MTLWWRTVALAVGLLITSPATAADPAGSESVPAWQSALLPVIESVAVPAGDTIAFSADAIEAQAQRMATVLTGEEREWRTFLPQVAQWLEEQQVHWAVGAALSEDLAEHFDRKKMAGPRGAFLETVWQRYQAEWHQTYPELVKQAGDWMIATMGELMLQGMGFRYYPILYERGHATQAGLAIIRDSGALPPEPVPELDAAVIAARPYADWPRAMRQALDDEEWPPEVREALVARASADLADPDFADQYRLWEVPGALIGRLGAWSATEQDLQTVIEAIAAASVEANVSARYVPWLALALPTREEILATLTAAFAQGIAHTDVFESHRPAKVHPGALVGLAPYAVAGVAADAAEMNERMRERLWGYVETMAGRRDQFAQQEMAAAVSLLLQADPDGAEDVVRRVSYLGQDDPRAAMMAPASDYHRWCIGLRAMRLAGQPTVPDELTNQPMMALITLRYFPAWDQASQRLEAAAAADQYPVTRALISSLFFAGNQIADIGSLESVRQRLEEAVGDERYSVIEQMRAACVLARDFGEVGMLPTALQAPIQRAGFSGQTDALVQALWALQGVAAAEQDLRRIEQVLAQVEGGGPFMRWWLQDGTGTFPVEDYQAWWKDRDFSAELGILRLRPDQVRQYEEDLRDPRLLIGRHHGGKQDSTRPETRDLDSLVAPSVVQRFLAELDWVLVFAAGQ